MADAPALGAGDRKVVGVRVPSRAQRGIPCLSEHRRCSLLFQPLSPENHLTAPEGRLHVRLDSGFGNQSPRFDGGLKLLMIGLGLIRIAHREPGNRFFEVLVPSDVRADLQ